MSFSSATVSGSMTKTSAHLSISLDGYIAGPNQDRDNPIGIGGLELHQWHLAEPIHEGDARSRDHLAKQRGACVMGRNMFGPIRGEWDEDWRGWWGDEPPYHAPVFVLTHYAHDPNRDGRRDGLSLRRRRFRRRLCAGGGRRGRARGVDRGRCLDCAPSIRRGRDRRARARYRAGATRGRRGAV